MTSSRPINWILVRGLSREVRHWGRFRSVLADRFPNGSVHTLELPGVGEKVHMKAPSHIGGYIKHLRLELEKLKEKHTGQWGLAAISMGGMIALKWAEFYPDDFDYVAVFNTSAGDKCLPWERFTPDAMTMVGKLFFGSDMKIREREILKITTHLTDITDELVDLWAGYSKEHPLTKQNFLRQLYAAAKFVVPKQIKPPLLVCVSANDRLCAPNCSMILAKHFGVKPKIHHTAGHDLPLDAPEWLADRICEFANSV